MTRSPAICTRSARLPSSRRITTARCTSRRGMGRMLARTGWDPNATWFTYLLKWNQIDHQLADGNQFEFYRRGEWLTKERTGYDGSHFDAGCGTASTEYHNTLALQNDPPA